MSDLKPCPFCGGMAEWDEGEQRVYCTSCGCMPGTYDLPIDHDSDVMPGVQVWNIRTADTELAALRAEVAALKARKVKLPQRYAEESCTGYDSYLTERNHGEYMKTDDVIDAIRAAGYPVEGE